MARMGVCNRCIFVNYCHGFAKLVIAVLVKNVTDELLKQMMFLFSFIMKYVAFEVRELKFIDVDIFSKKIEKLFKKKYVIIL